MEDVPLPSDIDENNDDHSDDDIDIGGSSGFEVVEEHLPVWVQAERKAAIASVDSVVRFRMCEGRSIRQRRTRRWWNDEDDHEGSLHKDDHDNNNNGDDGGGDKCETTPCCGECGRCLQCGGKDKQTSASASMSASCISTNSKKPDNDLQHQHLQQQQQHVCPPPLLLRPRSLAAKLALIDQAVSRRHGDTILETVLFLKETVKHSVFVSELKQRREARDAYASCLRRKGETQELAQL